MLLDETISAILQILVFTFIPFLVYLFKNSKADGFLDYIGIKKSNRRANRLGLLLCLVFAVPLLLFSIFNADFFEILSNPESVTGKFRQMEFGFGVVLTILVVALFKTSLSEEILFRGFIAKRLIAWTNYQTGNILQAVIFGAIHTALFFTISTNVLFLIVIFFAPALGAYFSVYLNEKVADGSIIPGWIAHGMANVLSYSIFGFLV